VDVICVGESMVMLAPPGGAALEDWPPLHASAGGAESNVACVLAQLGHRAAWVSRLGQDPMGRLVHRSIEACGVDTSRVTFDPVRPTGLYLKSPNPVGTASFYYRAGSAATAMGTEALKGVLERGPSLVHVSGITPALSTSCREMVRDLVRERRPGTLLSFDVNYRSALWSPAEAGKTLHELARGCDIVFVGLDEAKRIWGTSTPDDVRAVIPETNTLIVKDGGNGVTAYHGAQVTTVEPVGVNVVEPVGAGDAFAAGYLAGLLENRPVTERLRLGHMMAAVTMQHSGDFSHIPSRTTIDALLSDSASWPVDAGIRLQAAERVPSVPTG